MTLANRRPTSAIVTVTAPDGVLIHRAVLPGHAHKFVELPDVPSVRVNVVRRAERPRRRAAAPRVFAGPILASPKGVHYHDGVRCDDPNCPEAGAPSGGDGPSRRDGGLDPAVRGVLDLLLEERGEDREEEDDLREPGPASEPARGASRPVSAPPERDQPPAAVAPAATSETATVGVAAAGDVVSVEVNGVDVRIACLGERDPCDEIRARIAQVRSQLDAAREALEARTAECRDLQAALDAAERALRDAERDLQEASRPPDEGEAWVEDAATGRRITSRDLRLRRAASRAAWDRYRNGEISAHDLVREWERQGEDGALDRLRRQDADVREAARRRAEAARDAARAARDAAREAHDAKEAEKARLEGEIANLSAELERLTNELAECERNRPAAPPPSTPSTPPDDGNQAGAGGATGAGGTEDGGGTGEEDEGGSDEPWGGGVGEDGVTVADCCDLVKRIIEELAATPWGQTPRGAGIIETLRSYACGDMTFVVTVDDHRGRPMTPEVDGDRIYPGNAQYVRTMRMGIPGLGGFHSNEIYIGLDGSSWGIRQASRNAGDYYICDHEGTLCVISRADLIHNLVHEGLHAAQGGSQNVGDRASNQEERDAFAAGNEACEAMGVPPELSDAPRYGGDNPGYRPYTGD